MPKSSQFMTKEGVPIRCENCLYWTKEFAHTGRCGNANRNEKVTNFNYKCSDFWPAHKHRL